MASASSPSRTSTNRDLDNDDLDPAAFLKTVRELSEKREREDAERYRKLEEDVERSRAARVARRQGGWTRAFEALFTVELDVELIMVFTTERARSISPEKASASPVSNGLASPRLVHTGARDLPPPSTPPASTSGSITSNDAPMAGPPSPTKDIPEFKGFGSARSSYATSTRSPAQSAESSPQPAQTASSLARSGTLSWQRRPASRGAGSRPTSMISAGRDANVRPNSRDEPEPNRDQIAASLSARDPSWFKQTAERGVGSAAYRKSKDEVTSGDNVASGRRGLPGLSKETPVEAERRASPVPSESVKTDTPSRPTSVRDSGFSNSRFSTSTPSSTNAKPDLKSLIAADTPQHEASPMSDHTSSTGDDQALPGRTPSMSSSQARLANPTIDRPASPTKGAGGFVQSAMLRRSDSVNKRWSAQPGPKPNLSRQNSLASQRSGYGGLQGSHSMPRLEPTPDSRESSHEPSSRPSSSSSNLTALAGAPNTAEANDGFIKPALPLHHRSKSVASMAEDGAVSAPSSPSKRFSPTKSSWIESALTRPDSPKPAGGKNAQPSWMSDIAKAKAQRASAESTPRTGTPVPVEEEAVRPRSPTKALFGQGLLKRSESRDLAGVSLPSEPAARVKSIDVPGQSVQPVSEVRAVDTSKSITQTPQTDKRLEKDESQTSQAPATRPEAQAPAQAPVQLADQPAVKVSTPTQAPKPIPPSKAKPETPPKPPTDFRSTLRSRAPAERKDQETPEFLARFGNLRKTTTEKYVAPDVLKDNITRGKSDLAKTGGPVKTARRDELKESLLAKKDEWKKAKEDGTELPGQVHERKVSGAPPVTPSKPEALAKRELLGKAEGVKESGSPEKATPEALARHRSFGQKPVVEAPPPQKQTSVPQLEQPRMAVLEKQMSAPAEMEHKAPTGLAARFNPDLARILSLGPPSPAKSGASTPSRSASPGVMERPQPTSGASGEPAAEGAPLQDMRKGRASGPKRRKAGGAKEPTSQPEVTPEQQPEPAAPRVEKAPQPEPAVKAIEPLSTPTKPTAPPGSSASLMMASLRERPGPPKVTEHDSKPATPARSPAVTAKKPVPEQEGKPTTPARSPAIIAMKPQVERLATPARTPSAAPRGPRTPEPSTINQTPKQGSEVPDFGGFRSMKQSTPAQQHRADDNKENSEETTPSVKSAASFWSRQPAPKNNEAPPQIQLPNKKDEEAAMRSAGLLASSPARPSSRNGLGISTDQSKGDVSTPPTSAGLPTKPSKPSRAVSGQLMESSPNRGT